MEQKKEGGRGKQEAEGNPTAGPASVCLCPALISHVREIHQVLNNILQMQDGDTRWSPGLNQRDGETRCVRAHLRRANKPSRQLLISTISGDPPRWRAAVLMERVKLRQGDSINQQAGSSQQFMAHRLTGQGGAQGSKITIPRRSLITARGLIAYASESPPVAHIKFIYVSLLHLRLLHNEINPEIDILFLMSNLNMDVKYCARQK